MTDHIPEHMEARITAIGQQVSAGVKALCHEMLSDGLDLQTVEERMQGIVREAGKQGLEVVVGEMDREREKGRRPCPTCGQEVYWKQYAQRQCISTLGEFDIERAYYYCTDCGTGWCPLDEVLGLGRRELSPTAQDLASYLGAFMSFRRAADFLAHSGLLHISHDTVNAVTVEVGQQLRDHQQAETAAIWRGEEPYPEYEGAEAPDVLYLSGDGVRYLNTEGQGRELKVAAVYQTEAHSTADEEAKPRAHHIDYLVSQRDPEQFRRTVEVRTQQRGLRAAEVSVVLQDGARWLWQHLAPLAGAGRVEIIDFYHTARYVKDALEVLVDDPDVREFWKEVLLTCLKDGKGYLVTDTLRHLLSDPDPLSDPVQDACDYIRNHGHRMHYDDYQEAGLQIASGTIESGVRQVASDRLKQAGMRWNPDHAEAVAQVRAAILSQQPRWDDFWQSYVPPSRSYQSHAQAA